MRLFLLLTLVISCSAFVQTSSMRKVNHIAFRDEDKLLFPLRQTASLVSSTVRLLSNRDDDEVNVNLIDNVDSFTLTAVGFGLIAFNFFVLANVR